MPKPCVVILCGIISTDPSTSACLAILDNNSCIYSSEKSKIMSPSQCWHDYGIW
jgi:hypothetical protein